MSLPRVLVMDVLTRYPEAETVEDAMKMHAQSLKAKVESKWRELEADENELAAFLVATGAQPTPKREEVVELPPAALVLPPAHEPAYTPRIREVRPREGTNEREYRYGSNQYIEVAARQKLGTHAPGRQLWLTSKEVRVVRHILARKDAERLASGNAGRVIRRVSLGRDRKSRVREGTTIFEYKYRSSEYTALAYTESFGTLDGEYVWLTQPELDHVREVVRGRHDNRVRARVAGTVKAR